MDRPSEHEINAFQAATRDLIGVALRSLDGVTDEVSLPQLRLLLALHDTGRCPSSHVARTLGLGSSSVTRLADRLTASGHVRRGTDPAHRSVVTLELTARGKRLVNDVLTRRHAEFRRVLARIPPALRASTADGLIALHEALGDVEPTPMPV